MQGYGSKEVANLLGISTARLARWVRNGWVEPTFSEEGEPRFSFRDVVLLRRAKQLLDQRVQPSRVKAALDALRRRLPNDTPLSAVPIRLWGGRLVASDASGPWEPESGQSLFRFADEGEPVPRAGAIRSLPETSGPVEKTEDDLSADEWFELGADLESFAADQARDAYRRCLELDPEHGEARMALGRLALDRGRLDGAEAHFRIAHLLAPTDPVASFHLGLALEALEREEEARGFFEAAVRTDPRFEDAYVALARVQERLSDRKGALRTLSELRRLRDEPE
jgi:tetratricopeptide (TPR) repeat protein